MGLDEVGLDWMKLGWIEQSSFGLDDVELD